ncbi:MAG: hypothetical protein IJ323_05100 [Clostridia bacterium]|nr:hypothetical protein [Clostridia bacterium]MBQ7897785.1 hypothetical protein [Clostridia bacterium]
MSNRPFFNEHRDLKYAIPAMRKKGNTMDNSFKRASSEYAFNYTEHLVKRGADKNIIIGRALIVLLTLILFGAVVFLTFGPIKLPHIVVVAVVLILYIAKLLWGFTSIEYEYLIVSGEMSMDKIYGGRKRVKMTEFNIHDALSIAPLSETRLDGARVIFGATSMKDDDLYCAVYNNADGEKEALIFNVHEKALQMLKYYNKSTVIK